MKVECIRCGQKFENIKDFKNHLKGRKNCKATYISIPSDKYNMQFKLLNDMFKNEYNEIRKKNILHYGCEYCGKTFSNTKYYYRHKKHHCSKREANEILYDMDYIMNNNSNNTNTNSGNTNTNSLNTQNIEQQNNIQTQNNINNSNINSNNVVNNFIIKNYSDNEDNDQILKTIPDDIKKKLLTNPQTAIENIHKLIHIDNPEYRNIYIKDIKEGHGYVYNNGEWDIKIMNDLLEELLVLNCDRIYDIMNDEDIKVKKAYINNLTDLFEKISDNGVIARTLKHKIKVMTYCYKNTIKDNYENSSKKKLRLIAK